MKLQLQQRERALVALEAAGSLDSSKQSTRVFVCRRHLCGHPSASVTKTLSCGLSSGLSRAFSRTGLLDFYRLLSLSLLQSDLPARHTYSLLTYVSRSGTLVLTLNWGKLRKNRRWNIRRHLTVFVSKMEDLYESSWLLRGATLAISRSPRISLAWCTAKHRCVLKYLSEIGSFHLYGPIKDNLECTSVTDGFISFVHSLAQTFLGKLATLRR